MLTTTETQTDKETVAESFQQSTTENPNVCEPNDKECIRRMIQAFSDCD